MSEASMGLQLASTGVQMLINGSKDLTTTLQTLIEQMLTNSELLEHVKNHGAIKTVEVPESCFADFMKKVREIRETDHKPFPIEFAKKSGITEENNNMERYIKILYRDIDEQTMHSIMTSITQTQDEIDHEAMENPNPDWAKNGSIVIAGNKGLPYHEALQLRQLAMNMEVNCRLVETKVKGLTVYGVEVEQSAFDKEDGVHSKMDHILLKHELMLSTPGMRGLSAIQNEVEMNIEEYMQRLNAAEKSGNNSLLPKSLTIYTIEPSCVESLKANIKLDGRKAYVSKYVDSKEHIGHDMGEVIPSGELKTYEYDITTEEGCIELQKELKGLGRIAVMETSGFEKAIAFKEIELKTAQIQTLEPILIDVNAGEKLTEEQIDCLALCGLKDDSSTLEIESKIAKLQKEIRLANGYGHFAKEIDDHINISDISRIEALYVDEKNYEQIVEELLSDEKTSISIDINKEAGQEPIATWHVELDEATGERIAGIVYVAANLGDPDILEDEIDSIEEQVRNFRKVDEISDVPYGFVATVPGIHNESLEMIVENAAYELGFSMSNDAKQNREIDKTSQDHGDDRNDAYEHDDSDIWDGDMDTPGE